MKLLRYILFVIAVVSLQSGLAQRSDYQPEFTVGVKGGTTLSRVSFTPTVTQSLLLGIQRRLVNATCRCWYRFVISKKNFSG